MSKKDKHVKPPRLAQWILGRIRPDEQWNTPLGDFEEFYNSMSRESGVFKAWLWYWGQTVRLAPHKILYTFYWSGIMFKNYFTLAYRSLIKNKLLGVISIFSLSIAIGSAVAIFAIMDVIYSFNKSHENAEQIFQVENIINRDGAKEIWGSSPVPLGPALKADFPQIKRVVRIENSSGIMKFNDKVFDESFHFVDGEYLEMFTFPLKSGEKTALKNKNAVVLAEEIAIKYFGEDFPIGKEITIRFNNGTTSSFTVQGVADKFPVNAGFSFNILVPYENRIDAGMDNFNDWKDKTRATFIQLDNPQEIGTIQKQMGKYLTIQNAADADWPAEQFLFDPLLKIAQNRYKTRRAISI